MTDPDVQDRNTGTETDSHHHYHNHEHADTEITKYQRKGLHKEKKRSLSDSVFLSLSVKSVTLFSFRDFLAQSMVKNDMVSVLQNRGIAQMAKNEWSVLARERQNAETAGETDRKFLRLQ